MTAEYRSPSWFDSSNLYQCWILNAKKRILAKNLIDLAIATLAHGAILTM
ncbi:MAG TPA: hypothetical protein V6C71_21180 [Coleofasciculaceae cyanobacterium]